MNGSGRQTILEVIKIGSRGGFRDYAEDFMALMFDTQQSVITMAKTDPNSPNSFDQQQIYQLKSFERVTGRKIAFVDANGTMAREGKPVYQLNGRNITSAILIKENSAISLFTKIRYILFAGKSYIEVDQRFNDWNRLTKFEVKNLTDLLCSGSKAPDSKPGDPPNVRPVPPNAKPNTDSPPNVKPNPDSPPEETPGDSNTTTIVIIIILILIVALIVFVVLIVRNYIQKQREISNPNSDKVKTSTTVVQQAVQ